MLSDVVRKSKIPAVTPPDKAALEFLKKHKVPAQLIKTLEVCSVARSIPVGRILLRALSELPSANQKPNHQALAHGFLVIGSGLNGDPIAVELKNGQVAFLSHELLWGYDPEVADFEDCVARSSLDTDAFWTRAHDNQDFPVDFYEAGGSR